MIHGLLAGTDIEVPADPKIGRPVLRNSFCKYLFHSVLCCKPNVRPSTKKVMPGPSRKWRVVLTPGVKWTMPLDAD